MPSVVVCPVPSFSVVSCGGVAVIVAEFYPVPFGDTGGGGATRSSYKDRIVSDDFGKLDSRFVLAEK